MENTKTRILRKLREREGFVSGQELCEELGISRTAVWKYIRQLEAEGYRLEAVPNRGYCLRQVPDILSESEIQSRLHTRWVGQKVVCLAEVDSTNIRARRLAEEGAPSGTLVAADRQTKGRGSRGRSWESPAGESIYMTLLLRPEFSPASASMLTLVMGLSAVQGMEQVTGAALQIKWPNDVVLNGKKVVGILTEMSAQVDYIEHLVIGVGVNVNGKEFPQELQDKATSLAAQLGKEFCRAGLAAAILEAFERNYEIFCRTEDLSGLKEEYQRVLANAGKQVRVLDPASPYSGLALGIDERGQLLVRREDGTLERVYAGEVSVRGLYSYV